MDAHDLGPDAVDGPACAVAGGPRAVRVGGGEALLGGEVGHRLGLGGAIGDQDLGLREGPAPGAKLGVGDRSATGEQAAQRWTVPRFALHGRGETVEEGGRGGAGGHAVAPHLGEDAGAVHPVDPPEVHGRHHRGDPRRQVVQSEDGEHGHVDFPLLGRELGGEGGSLGQQKAVGAVGSLGLARGAAGEGDEGRVGGGDGVEVQNKIFRRGGACPRPGGDKPLPYFFQIGEPNRRRPGTEAPAGGDGDGDGAQPPVEEAQELALADPDPGAGLGEGREGGDLAAADPGIDEDRDRAHPQQGEHRDIEVDRHRDHDDRALSRAQPLPPPPRRGPADAVPEVAEGDRSGLQDQRRAVRMAAGEVVEDGEDVGGGEGGGGHDVHGSRGWSGFRRRWALITPALFSHRTPPGREKREESEELVLKPL
jgi:hypothetical protein